MPLVGTGEIVDDAARRGGGVGAFNVILVEHAEAVAAGAERAGLPAVLQISENAVRYHGGTLAPIGRATVAVASAAGVPVAVHLDHATGPELVAEAVAEGFGSVMFDASTSRDTANRAATAAVARWCHARGLWVEAELGEVGGKDGVHAPGARTDPAQAERFVVDTAVDALAVAVGSSHAMLTKSAELDMELIGALRRRLPVPLVLHGASGVPERYLADAVRHGMTKINVATQINAGFTRALRSTLDANPGRVDPRSYLAPARDAVSFEVTRLLRLLGGAEAG